MEEDDPVVQEIPVYLSQALAKNLYVYQYPARPSTREWSDVKVTNASIKPKNQLVRVEIGLDRYSDKYCESKGELIALNTDGHQESSRPFKGKDKDKEKMPYFPSGTMDKIVYESCEPTTEPQHFAVGILQDKELHITPIKGLLQMRQVYSYFDKQDKRKQDKNKPDSDDEEEKEPDAQQVTVKFARQETDVAKKAREKSFEAISQRVSSEHWYDTMWKHCDTDHAELEMLKLFSSTTADGSALTLGSQEYVRALVPAALTEEEEMQPVKKLTLQEQVKELLVAAKLMRLREVCSRVRAAESAVLCALRAGACLVRGLWAPRSDHLLPAHRARARDHLLYLFTQHSYVIREKIAATVKLPPDDVLEVLRSVAKYNSNINGWELLLPPDTAFEAKYPEIVQRQNMYWEARQRQFNEMSVTENAPKRQRKKSQRESISSDTMMSPKARCNSVSEEDSDKKRNKKGAGKRTRHISSSSVQENT